MFSEAVILIVDDDQGVLRLCQRLLERAGFQVIAASSASQALAILARERVDLMLADIRMPAMDGFQLMALARRHQPDLAVVMMTGFGTVDIALEALNRGADGLVLKPFDKGEILGSVQRALGESQQKQDAQRLRALRPLFDLTRLLYSESDLGALHHLIVDSICSYLKCAHAGLYSREAADVPLSVVAHLGGLLQENGGHLGKELASIALSEGIPLWMNRDGSGSAAVSHWDVDVRTELQSLMSEFSLQSVICVPIDFRQGNYVLLAVREESESAFREVEVEMFGLLAQNTEVALEKAILYSDLRASIQKLEKSQHALTQAEKMSAAGRLTASIAHEINNPLQSLNNCLHLIGREELSLEARQEYLKLAQSEMDRLMGTVQHMLDLYRPGVRERQLVPISELVNRVLLLIGPQLQKTKVQVHTQLDPDLPKVTVVASQIQQVLLNLILNAMEAMPDGGEISIWTDQDGDEVEIIIEDTGPGINSTDRDLIFEPFYSTKENGTGLGLPVSLGIIEAHGGSLDLLEGLGKGARFRINLPVGGD